MKKLFTFFLMFGFAFVHLACDDDSDKSNNNPPSITNLPATEQGNANEDDSFQVLGTDEDPDQTLSWSIDENSCSFTPTIDASGLVSWTCGSEENCSVQIVLSDNGKPSLDATGMLNIECLSNLPEFETNPAQNAVEHSEYIYSVACSDPNGESLTLALGDSHTCGGAIVDNGDGTGTFSFVPNEEQGGEVCVLHLTCANSEVTESQNANVAVVETNSEPAIVGLPSDQSSTWGSEDSYQVDVEDPDIPENDFNWEVVSTTCTFNPDVSNDGLISWTCTSPETCNVDIRVTDDGYPSMSDTETLTIQCVNSLPAFDSTPLTTATEHVGYLYDISCTDPENDPIELQLGASHTCNGNLVDNGDGTGEFSFLPDEEQGGTSCNLHVVCSDGLSSETQTAQIDIIETNSPPLINGLPATETGLYNQDDSYQLTGEDSDIPADTLNWEITSDTCSFAPTIDNDGLVSWTCGLNVESCQIDIRLADDGSPVLDATGTLNVECVNSLPSFTSSPAIYASEQSEYNYNVVCSDPEGDPLSLELGTSDTCGPTLTDNGDGTGTYSFTPDESQGGESCVLHITCSDPVASESQTVNINISEVNDPPSIVNLPTTVDMHWNDPGSYTCDATDTDIPVQDISWSISHSNCSFTPTIGAISGELTWSCSGEENCTVDVRAVDSGSPTKNDEQSLTINCTNTPPAFTSTPDSSVIEGDTYVYDFTCEDPDGDTIAIIAGSSDTCDGTVVDNGDGTGSYSFDTTEGDGGSSCLMAIKCSDSADSVNQANTIIVTESNAAPELTNLPASDTIHWNATGNFSPTYSDSDTPAQTMTWSVSGNTCSFTPDINSSTGELSYTCVQVENCSFDVTVTDNGSPAKSDTETFSLSCTNTGPAIISTAPGTAAEGSTYSYAVECADPDSDPLSLTVGSTDSCGGTLADNGDGTGSYEFIPDESAGGTSCQVDINCTDTQDATNQVSAVSINETNEAPTIVNLPTTVSTHWNSSNSYTVEYEDTDQPAQTISYAISNNTCSFGPSLDTSTGLVSWTCTQVESCSVDITATDDGVPSLSDTKTLSLQCINHAPDFTSAPPASVQERENYSYNIVCSDEDGDPLSLSIRSVDTCGGALIDNGNGTGTYSFSTDESQGGSSCKVALSCGDSIDTTNQSQTVSIVETNEDPVIDNLPATETLHWNESGSFVATATDADDPVQTITWSLGTDTCSFAPSVNSSTGEVSYTCNEVESCTVQVIATDDFSPAGSDTKELAIDCTNDAPVINSSASTSASEGETYTYNVSCSDTNNDTLSLTLGTDTCGGTLSDNGDGSGSYSFTPTETQGGSSCNFEIQCNDTQDTDSQSNTVNVTETNQAPVITGEPYNSSTNWDASDSFTATATDADEPAQSISWSIENNTCTFTPTIGSSTGEVNYTCTQVEDCTVDVVATDDGSPTLSDTATLNISCTNTAPEITSTAPTAVNENKTYSYSVVCSDADGNTLSLAKGGADTCGGTLTDNGDGNGTYEFTPGESDGGSSCAVDIVCSDTIDTDQQTTTVNIAETNEEPVIDNLPATETLHWDESGSFTATASDADEPAQSISWSLGTDTCSFTPTINSSGKISYACTQVEDCTVEVVATDDGDPPKSTTELLSISCTNAAPVIGTTAPTSVNEGDTYTYDVSCTDSDGDALTLTLGAADTCGGTLNESGNGSVSGTYSFTTDETSGDTSCVVDIQCGDTQETDEQNVTVQINEVNHAPVIDNLPATETLHWNESGSYGVTATDSDEPADTLTWSIETTTCSSFSPAIDSSTGMVSWTCTQTESCSVDILVTDDGSPALTDSGTLSIECTNANTPAITSTPASTEAYEEVLYVYDITCSDGDGDALTLAAGSSDTCGGTAIDNGDGTGSYEYIPADGTGDATCVMDIVCSDGDAQSTQSTDIFVNITDTPAVNDLAVTEIMISSDDATTVKDGQWFEVYNTTSIHLKISGVGFLIDNGTLVEVHEVQESEAAVVGPGEYLVIGANSDPLLNGGVVTDHIFDTWPELTDATGYVEIYRTADSTIIDAVDWDDTWNHAYGASLNLSPGALDTVPAVDNDSGSSWCHSRFTNIDGSGMDLGTPGTANDDCLVSRCNLQSPDTVTTTDGSPTELIYGRVFEPGITDDSTGQGPFISSRLGYGADTSDPDEVSWTWFPATYNMDYGNDDEYMQSITPDATGIYDYAYSFSMDGGLTWLYCDLSGTDDGYDPADAGELTVNP